MSNAQAGRRFTPAHFLDLLKRERRWCELLIIAILTRSALQDLDVELVTDDTVAVALTKRARALRN